MKRRLFLRLGRWLVLCLAAGLTSAVALPWVERHGMSLATLQSEVNLWTKPPYNFRVTKLSGSETNGAARYAAIFEARGNAPASLARYGLTAGDFTALHDLIHGAGYRLVWLDGFGVGNTAYYNGIWEHSPRTGAQRVRLGETLTSHSSANLSNVLAGYALTDLSSFSVNGAPRHAGVWTWGGGGDYQFRHHRTGAEYQSDFETLGAQGYYLRRVSGYEAGGGHRFSGVWRKTSLGSGWSYHGMRALDFTSHNYNAIYQGYRPVFIDAYNVGADTYYNATWVRNGGLPVSRLNAISTFIDDYMQDRNLPGLSLAIARRGQLVYARGFGYADKANWQPAHPLHRWRIASVSKPICAVAALRALEDSAAWSLGSRAFGSGGLFGNDFGDPAGTPYNTNEKAITLRQLLNMTAGWNDEGKLWYGSEPNYGVNHAQIIGWHLDNKNPTWTPGTHYKYNNFNYQVAARIPEKITGLSFEGYCKQQIFDPCGMVSPAMGNRTAAGRLANEVAYYDGDQWGSPENVWPARMDGSTAWVTRPADLLLMARRIDGNPRHADIIGAYALSQMRLGNGQPDDNGNTSTYGLGWYAGNRHGRAWWQHNGAMAGTQAILVASADGELAFAYAANSIHSSDTASSTLRNKILDLMNDIETANAWPAVNLFGKYNPAYDAWATAAFGASVTNRPGVYELWAPDADPDGDGRPNALEAFLGSDPTTPDPASWASVSVTNTHLILRWTKKIGDRGVTPTPEWSNALGAWGTSSAAEIVTRNDLITFIGHTVQEARLARSSHPARFLRLALDVR